MGNAILNEKEFHGFKQLIFDRAGIHMSNAKKPLVSGRLAKRLLQRGLDTYSDYLHLIQQDQAERQTAIDLLTTNETYFYREPKHFEFLSSQIAPALRQQSEVRIWSAACSSGEEPYTLAMVLAEALGHTRFDILASDISTRVLETARQGLYPIEDAANIPKSTKARYCLKGVGSQEGWFLVDKPLRDKVSFDQINLNERLPDVGLFDVIFLRNVMIYFSVDTKKAVMARMVAQLKPGGWFFISHSESLHGVTDQLQMVRPSIYRKRPD
ncbi:MAG: protein-glutamate O-methyltransferase CheR [Aquabacterium sp.]|uniref:CheR family methyltransferase n=1 Tax=Aquabacterium sp. TaxID=1872578 RepID=UPI00121BCAEA|nr:protein-glutamate O-methyltransferase CheR [Aquabacterium sp.]TAK88744.1 MAG: protein-glutamate O-methyltransferase CheR [Aquabacterium sp.]